MFKTKNFLLIFLFLSTAGCATVSVPNYIYDKHPYKKEFYGQFNEILDAVKGVLKDHGWEISKTTDPSVYEQGKSNETADNKALLITEIRQTSFFFGSSYSRLNVFLRPGTDKRTEVEFRYLAVNSFPIKAFNSYRKDKLIDRFFKDLDERLK